MRAAFACLVFTFTAPVTAAEPTAKADGANDSMGALLGERAEDMPEVVRSQDGSSQDALPALSADPSFEPSYRIQSIEVRGNRKTRSAIILRETGLLPGDVVQANDPRVALARLRLLALGFFLDVHLSVVKGDHRGLVNLIVEVEERGTLVLDAIYLGTSDATGIWGGLAATERNVLGTGLSVGAGAVGSTTPDVTNARPGFASALRVAGPPAFFSGRLALQASFLASRGSEFFRTAGSEDSSNPADFTAADIRRLGGAFGAGHALTRTVFLLAEARFESIHASLPDELLPAPGGTPPPTYGLRRGSSQLTTFTALLDIDSRSDPVLPRNGHHIVLSIEGSTSGLASSYRFVKGVAQSSSYLALPSGHVLGFHGFLGGIWGDAPMSDRFFVGDFNQLLPPRALGLNFSTQPSRDLLGMGMAARRYEKVAGRFQVEYAIPLWKRHGLLYRGDAFAALGVFALSNPSDWDRQGASFAQRVPMDLTADLGIRLDTYIGIFTLSVANAIGRIPF